MYGGGQGYGGGYYASGGIPPYGAPLPMGTMHPPMGMGVPMHPANGEFEATGGYMQGTPGASPYMQPGQQPKPRQTEQPPPTDEEQAWLEAQMDKGEAEKKERADAEASAAAPAAVTIEPDGGYDDVMKMIEENRRKNEAKRAAQSARNAEITAAFEARMAGNSR